MLLAGCGGGGGPEASGPGQLSARARWQGIGAGTDGVPSCEGGSTTIPPTVDAARVIFRSQAMDFACCLSFTPASIADRVVVLTELAPGNGTLQVSGYAGTQIAPAPPGEDLIRCRTQNNVGAACGSAAGRLIYDTVPSQSVAIIPGQITQTDICIRQVGPTPAPTATASPTQTAAQTETSTPTSDVTFTPTFSATEISSVTPTPTLTSTSTLTPTSAPNPTLTPTAAPQFAYVANTGPELSSETGTVSVIDLVANAVVATIPVGLSPSGVALGSEGSSVFVTNSRSSSVSVIDTLTNTVVRTPTTDGNNNPVDIVLIGQLAYTTAQTQNLVSVNDIDAFEQVEAVPVGSNPFRLAATPDGAFVYVPNTGTDAVPGETVSVIDTSSNLVTATVTVGLRPLGVAIGRTSVGLRAFVANSLHGDSNPSLSVIDAETHEFVGSVELSDDPLGVAISPDGTTVYATQFDNLVSVINTADNSVARTIAVGVAPFDVAVSPDGRLVCVTNTGDRVSAGTTSVITVGPPDTVVTIPVGINPQGVEVGIVPPQTP